MSQDEIVNKVAQSGIITIDLEEYYDNGERVSFDMVDHLFQGMVLKEKDFRTFVKEEDWSKYKGKNVALYCSNDAIIQTWAYMLVASAMGPYANHICFGTLEELEKDLYKNALRNINPEDYKGQRVVIKGCGDKEVPASAYTELTGMLLPHVKTLMYGEPCSTVPVYKKKS